MAAYTAGVTTVLIPHDNLRDLEEIDPIARQSMTFVPCKCAQDVLNVALVSPDEKEQNAAAAAAFIPPVQSHTGHIRASENHS